MAPQDLWYLKKRGPNDERIKSKRYGRGRRWRVNYTDPRTGEERHPAFDTKVEAEQFENNIKADISQGRYVDPRAGQMTVRQYGEQWLKTRVDVDPTTYAHMERGLRLHVYPLLGHEQLGNVFNSHIRGWVADRSKSLAPVSLTVLFNTVVGPLFKAAVLDRRIGSSPCVAIKLPSIPPRSYHIPTVDKVHALARALLPRFRAVPWIAAGAGLRPSEIMGLEKNGVAFLNREIDVAQQLKYVTGRGLYLGPTKTRVSRTVDLPTIVAEAIAEQLRVAPPSAWEMKDETNPREVRTRPVELVVTMPSGRPVYPADWSDMWRDAVVAAGLPKGFRLHDLRHFYATSLIHNGASVETVRKALGHATLKTTFQTYVHEWPDLKDTPKKIMDQVFAAAS